MIAFFSLVRTRRIILSGRKIEGFIGISFISIASWIQPSTEWVFSLPFLNNWLFFLWYSFSWLAWYFFLNNPNSKEPMDMTKKWKGMINLWHSEHSQATCYNRMHIQKNQRSYKKIFKFLQIIQILNPIIWQRNGGAWRGKHVIFQFSNAIIYKFTLCWMILCKLK